MTARAAALDLAFRAARPALGLVDPETAHRAAVAALRFWPGRADPEPDDPVLGTTVFGLAFANPVGLAPGFDKHAETVQSLPILGFGHAEIGGVTPRPQPGNPRPRLFRLDEDAAVINRYGLNSQGLDQVGTRLARRRPSSLPVGANLGKNKDTADEAADYVEGVRRLAGLVDWVTINVSSPNTPGLRALQAGDALRRIVSAAQAARAETGRTLPILVKLAPDLPDDELAAAAAVAKDTRVDGLVMGNTTTGRPPGLASRHRGETGGLSGAPLRSVALERIATLHRLVEGTVPIVGSGGIASGADAFAAIRAGASLMQLYSALVFGGPGLVATIKRDLAALLRRNGFASVSAAVGIAA